MKPVSVSIHRALVAVFIFLLVSLPLSNRPVYAASARLYLSPSASTVYKGNTFSVSVRENSGSEPVNAVQANLSYSSNLLQFVSISSSSSFAVVAQSSGGGGSVKIARGAQPSVTGDKLVASVRFRVLASSGKATVSIAGGSSVVSAKSNKNIMTSSSGGSYTLAPAPPAPPPAAKDTITPTIKDVKADEITSSSAVVSWVTSEPTSSEVLYGLNAGYGLSAGSGELVTNHKVTLSSALLIPGTTYHYMVRSIDPGGNTVTSNDATFTTMGATLAVTVINQDNKPVSDAKINLANQTATTDKNGKAEISGLPVGKLNGVVEHKGKRTSVSVDVKPIDPNGVPQAVTLKIEATLINPLLLIVPLLLILGGLIYFIKRNRGPGSGSGTGKSLKRYIPFLGRGPKSGPPTPPPSQPNLNPPPPTIVRPTSPS
jgi:hypothetical protein